MTVLTLNLITPYWQANNASLYSQEYTKSLSQSQSHLLATYLKMLAVATVFFIFFAKNNNKKVSWSLNLFYNNIFSPIEIIIYFKSRLSSSK